MKNSHLGFTLMELLVSSILAALVMSAVYTSFSSTIRIWRIGEEDLAAYQDTRLALALIQRDLKAIVPDTWDLVEGNAKELSWLAIRPPFYPDDDAKPRIMRIKYYVRPDGSGKYRLIRDEQPLLQFLPLKSANSLLQRKASDLALGRRKTVELCTGITGLTFRYYWTVLPPKPQPDELTTSPTSPPPVATDDPSPTYGSPQVVQVTLEAEDPSAETGKTAFDSWITLPGSLPRILAE